MNILTNLILIGLFIAIKDDIGTGHLVKSEKIRRYLPPGPPIISPALNPTVMEGITINLQCHSSGGNPPPIIKWYRVGVSLSDTTELASTNTLAVIRLTPRRTDRAVYKCAVWNKAIARPLEQIVMLNVIYPPSVKIESKEVGNFLYLNCVVDANPIMQTFVWFRNGYKFSNNFAIKINKVDPRDAGDYICVAENRLGRAEAKYTLNVLYPPIVSIEGVQRTFIIRAGEKFSVRCIVNANPAPNAVGWFKQEDPRFKLSGQYLTIHQVSPQSAGTYICQAVNNINGMPNLRSISITLNVLHTPGKPKISPNSATVNEGVSIEGEQRTFEIREGERFSVKCIVNANPAPFAVGWLKKDEPDFKQLGQVLTIDEVSRNSTGIYICRAVNAMNGIVNGEITKGIGNDSVTLIVRHKPGQPKISPKNGTVIEGVEVTFTCTADPPGWPPSQYRWCRESSTMPTNRDLVDSARTNECHEIEHQNVNETLPSAMIKLRPSKKDDGSIYKCVVRNEIMPVGETEIRLDVEYPPKILTISKNVWTVEIGKSVTLECIVDAKPKVKSVTWTKNGHLVSTDLVFTINKAYLQDAGDYICTADNGLGKVEAKHTLNVL